jgi:hypothetical protein
MSNMQQGFVFIVPMSISLYSMNECIFQSLMKIEPFVGLLLPLTDRLVCDHIVFVCFHSIDVHRCLLEKITDNDVNVMKR